MNLGQMHLKTEIRGKEKDGPVNGINFYQMIKALLEHEPSDDTFQKTIDSTSQSIRVILSEGVLKIRESKGGDLTIVYETKLVSDSIHMNSATSNLPDDLEDLFRSVSEAVLKIKKH